MNQYTHLMTSRLGVLLLVGLAVAGLGAAAGSATRLHGAGRLDPPGADSPHRVDRERLLRDITTLASDDFEGRRAGTAGGVKARAWIVNEMKEAGLTPGVGKGFVEPFTFVYMPGRGTSFPALSRSEIEGSANVVGRVESTSRGKWIVVSAHYDHLGTLDDRIYHGADDNASGVAALLAAARWLHAHPPRHPMLFIAFDAEEFGSHGAKAFLKANILKKDEIAIDVNLDMVSRNDKGELFAAGTYQSPWLLPILSAVQQRAAVHLKFGHDRPEATSHGLDDWTHDSDQGPFADAGVPFVYFGVEDHADYHKPTDTVDRIQPTFFGDAADTALDAVIALDQTLP